LQDVKNPPHAAASLFDQLLHAVRLQKIWAFRNCYRFPISKMSIALYRRNDRQHNYRDSFDYGGKILLEQNSGRLGFQSKNL
jgi:hypothetical protein